MEEFERGGRVCRVGLSRKGQKNNRPEDEKKRVYDRSSYTRNRTRVDVHRYSNGLKTQFKPGL